MSGWIKFEKSLRDDPRVIRIARQLGNAGVTHPRFTSNALVTLVLGCLTQLWCYADTHVREGDVLDLGIDDIDEVVGVQGFCSLIPNDWLEVIDAEHVKLPGFLAHNGTEARKKALTQKRVARHREGSVTPERVSTKRTCNADALPDQDLDQTRPDQKKEGPSDPVPQKRDVGVVDRVFEHWRAEFRHPKASLDPRRKRAIQRALEGYDEPTLCQAISGYKLSPHHMGQNDQRTVYDDISLFLRDAEHVERGLNFARAPPVAAKSAVEIARERLRGSANGRVVSEQSGESSEGGVGPPVRVLR